MKNFVHGDEDEISPHASKQLLVIPVMSAGDLLINLVNLQERRDFLYELWVIETKTDLKENHVINKVLYAQHRTMGRFDG